MAMSNADKRVHDMQERLDDVEEEIEEAREEAKDVLPREPKETFIQGGEVDPEHVDNTIVPPG